MPGENYANSIQKYWRVFSGNCNKAEKKCEEFYSKIINTKKYKLTKLPSIRDSEFCKILENSYRAVNIALIDEWSRLAERIGVSMSKVLAAIRIRPTHANIMSPGFGVGGYCLTKDPLFGRVSALKIFKDKKIKFPITSLSVKINDNMPSSSINILKKNLGSLAGKKILIFGVSYRENVGDCRYSPSKYFAQQLQKNGAKIFAYDPIVKNWEDYRKLDVSKIHNIKKMDALVLAVKHNCFKKINFNKLLKLNQSIIILDTFNVLTNKQVLQIKKKKCKIVFIGEGVVK